LSGEIGGRGLPGVCKITGFYEFFAKHFCWVGANVCAEGSSLGRMSYIIPLATLLPPFSSDDRYSIDGWIDCRKSIYTHTHMTTDRRKPTLVLPGRRLVAMGRVRRRECETKKYLEVGCSRLVKQYAYLPDPKTSGSSHHSIKTHMAPSATRPDKNKMRQEEPLFSHAIKVRFPKS
jgi:hypothetical protein